MRPEVHKLREGLALLARLARHPAFLYANPDAFFDVVKGTNAYGRGPFTTPVGFGCAPGWDAATGLGTPRKT